MCKTNVQGASCNQCKGNTWGLSLEYETGCILCECDPTGTQLGDINSIEDLACNQNTGACSCLANRIGRQCDDCLAGKFTKMVNQSEIYGFETYQCHNHVSLIVMKIVLIASR